MADPITSAISVAAASIFSPSVSFIAAFTKQLGGKMSVAGPPGSTTHIDFNILPAGKAPNRPSP